MRPRLGKKAKREDSTSSVIDRLRSKYAHIEDEDTKKYLIREEVRRHQAKVTSKYNEKIPKVEYTTNKKGELVPSQTIPINDLDLNGVFKKWFPPHTFNDNDLEEI